jgi:riboflavin synthase
MFTGLVEDLGFVREVAAEQAGRRITVESQWARDEVAIGDSIAVNGACLTAVACKGGRLVFQLGPETLIRTNLGLLVLGDRVNLERALLPTSRMGGHFVQGHVDGIAHVAERTREGDWQWIEFSCDAALTDSMVPKGSVAVDGVSLTLVNVTSGRFRVMLIPHTLAHTTLGLREVGAVVNVETDILGKYVLQAIRTMQWKP